MRHKFIKHGIIFYLIVLSYSSFGQNKYTEEKLFKVDTVEKYLRTGDFTSLLKYTHDIQQHEWYNSKKDEIYNTIFLSFAQAEHKQTDNAINTLILLKQTLDTEDKKFLYIIQGMEGIIEYRNNNFIDCLPKLDSAINYLTTFNEINSFDNYLYAYFLRYIGRTYSEIGVYIQGISYLKKSNTIFSELKNIENTYVNFKYIGRIYQNSSKYDKELEDFAIENYIKALIGFKKHKMQDEIPWIYTIIADYYLLQNNALQAKQYQDSVFCLLNDNDIVLLGLSYNNFGKVYEIQKNYNNAKENYKTAIIFYKKLGNFTNRAVTYYNLSNVYFNEGEISESLKYADSTLVCSQKSTHAAKIGRAYLLFAEIYNETGEYRKAYTFQTKANILFDSLLTVQNYGKAAYSYKVLYKTEQKEKENQKLKFKQEIQNTKIRQKTRLGNIFFIIIILISLLFVIIFIQYRKKNSAYKKLVSKNLSILKKEEELKIFKEQILINLQKKEEEIEALKKYISIILQKKEEEIEALNNHILINLQEKEEEIEALNKHILINLDEKDVELKTDKEQTPKNTQTKNTKISEANKVIILQKIKKLFEEDKIYRNLDLTAEILAKKLSTNRTYLSQIIKTEFKMTFTYFRNEYRVKEVISVFSKPEVSAKFTIESIAKDAGFKATATFNTVFKKHTGVTPSFFRKSCILDK